MIKPYHLLLTILLTSGIWSCAPKVINQSTVTERDSLSVKVVHHYDTIRIKGETIFVTKTIRDTVSFRIEKKEGRADIILTNNKGKLTADCKCDSVQIAKDFALKDTTRYKFKETIRTRTIIKKESSNFGKFCEKFFILFCLVVLGVSAFKLRKFFV